MTSLAFKIDGVPRGKGRPRASARAFINDKGEPDAIVSMYTPPETVAAERDVLQAFQRQFPGHAPFAGAVMIRFVAIFPIPKSWPKYVREAAARGTMYHISKPDKDNIEKLLVDALNGKAWADDAQVQGGGIKRYGSPPRIDVWLDLIEQPDVAPPAQRRTQARLDAAAAAPAPSPAPRIPPKADRKRRDPKLQAAIDAALMRDGRS